MAILFGIKECRKRKSGTVREGKTDGRALGKHWVYMNMHVIDLHCSPVYAGLDCIFTCELASPEFFFLILVTEVYENIIHSWIVFVFLQTILDGDCILLRGPCVRLLENSRSD